MGRKQPVDDITSLREATREAHEMVQALREERRACDAAKAELVAAQEDLADMVKAIWDAKMDAVVEIALTNYSETVSKAIDEATQAVYERFDLLTDVLMNPQNYGAADVVSMREKHVTAVERIVLDKLYGPEGAFLG